MALEVLGHQTDKREVIFLWVPPELKLLLKLKATKNHRSVNAECNIILQRSVQNGDGLKLTLPD